MPQRCIARNRAGKRCGAWAVIGKTKCALHLDPGRAAQMGSKHRARTVLLPDDEALSIKPPETASDLLKLLANTMSQVHSRRIDVKVGNSLAYISTSLLRAIEVADLERRLTALEMQSSDATETTTKN